MIRLHTAWMGIPASTCAAHMRLVLLLIQVLLYRQQQMSDILQYGWFSWNMDSLPEGKRSGSVFSAAVCKIQASKRYIKSLPLVPKDKRREGSAV